MRALDRLIALDRLKSFLEEDAPFGDITTDIVVEPVESEAEVVSRDSGVIAGVEESTALLEFCEIEVLEALEDGSRMEPDDVILCLRGMNSSILKAERTILNLMSRMSGIATMTAEMVRIVHQIDPRVRVAATRKTAPGLRWLDKKAVALGGGDTHRITLSDSILIKDNHVAAVGNLQTCIERAKVSASFVRKVEVEVEDVEDAVEAAEAGADIVMLDNFSPSDLKRTVSVLEERGMRRWVTLEASGGVTPENIEEIAGSGIDVISMGGLTHSQRSLDIALRFIS